MARGAAGRCWVHCVGILSRIQRSDAAQPTSLDGRRLQLALWPSAHLTVRSSDRAATPPRNPRADKSNLSLVSYQRKKSATVNILPKMAKQHRGLSSYPSERERLYVREAMLLAATFPLRTKTIAYKGLSSTYSGRLASLLIWADWRDECKKILSVTSMH